MYFPVIAGDSSKLLEVEDVVEEEVGEEAVFVVVVVVSVEGASWW